MSKMYLLFSHQLTEKQEKEAFRDLGVEDCVYLPEDLQERWSQVPAGLESIRQYIEPVRNWLIDRAVAGDYLLVQGEFGAVYLMVDWAKQNDLIPVYATTERKIKEVKKGEEVKTIKEFCHQRFREYEEWELVE